MEQLLSKKCVTSISPVLRLSSLLHFSVVLILSDSSLHPCDWKFFVQFGMLAERVAAQSRRTCSHDSDVLFLAFCNKIWQHPGGLVETVVKNNALP